MVLVRWNGFCIICLRNYVGVSEEEILLRYEFGDYLGNFRVVIGVVGLELRKF